MARIPPLRIAGLDIAVEAPFIASELSYTRKAGRLGATEKRRLRRAEAITRAPFRRITKEYKERAPKGPISSIGGSVLGIAAAVPAYTIPASWFAGAALSMPAYVAGKWIGGKALAPIDAKIFGKQLRRTAKIKSGLEGRFRGV